MKGSSHDLLRWQRLQAAFTSEASTCKMILLYSIWRWYSVVSSCKTETSWTVWSSWIFLFKVTVRCLDLGTRSDAPKALRVVDPNHQLSIGSDKSFFFEYIIPVERAAGTNHPRNQLCQVSAPILLRPEWQPGQWGACSVGFPQLQ